MSVKTVCPDKCPGRYPGCGAHCKTFLEHREKSLERYEQQENERRVKEVLIDGARRMKRK
jgi:hypothetical protein